MPTPQCAEIHGKTRGYERRTNERPSTPGGLQSATDKFPGDPGVEDGAAALNEHRRPTRNAKERTQ